MSAGEGLRKRRQGYFVQVPRETIRDKRLSWKARGLLTYLLDMPDGWDVRSEVLATEGPDGKDAIRAALRELAQAGYYRLERRRLKDGRLVMGTAISESPVPEWAEESAEYDGKAVSVIQQADGSFKVKRKDGTLVDDGFAPEEPAPGPDDDGPDGSGGQSDSDASTVPAPEGSVTGTGFSGAGQPEVGSAAVGQADAGSPGAIRENETGDRSRTDSSLRSSSAAPSTAEPEPTPKQRADALSKTWFDHFAAKAPVLNGSRTFHGLRTLVTQAVDAGYDDEQIKTGLRACGEVLPSKARFQRELAATAGGPSGQPKKGYDDRAIWGEADVAATAKLGTDPSDDELRDIFGTGGVA